MHLPLVVLALAALAGAARADVLKVPADFPTLTEALDAVQPGDEIVLAAGDYPGPFAIMSKQDIVVRGQGEARLTGGTDSVPTLFMEGCTNVIIDHLSFPDAGGDAVFLTKSSTCTLRRLRVTGAAEVGIRLTLAGGSVVERCRVDGPGQNGIDLGEIQDVLVTRCIVTGTSIGVGASDGESLIFERCRITGVVGTGLALGYGSGAEGCIVRKNILLDCSTGITSDGVNNLVLQNRVQGSASSGLLVQPSSEGGLMQDNKLLDCGVGLLSQGVGVLLRGNRIVKSTEEGLVCGGDGCVIADNRVVKATQNAFLVNPTVEGGTVMDCKALKAGGDGFLVMGANVLLAGNTATGAASIGFHLTGNFNVLTGNTAKGSETFDLQDDGSGNNFVENQFGTEAP